MSICVQCGIERDDGALLCPQHERESLDTWAEGNRIICDWIHRGKLPEPSPIMAQDEAAWIRPWTPEVLRPVIEERSALAAATTPDFVTLDPRDQPA